MPQKLNENLNTLKVDVNSPNIIYPLLFGVRDESMRSGTSARISADFDLNPIYPPAAGKGP